MPATASTQAIEGKVNFADGWKAFGKNAARGAVSCWLRNSFAMMCCKQRSTRRCDYCATSSNDAFRLLGTQQRRAGRID